MSTLNTSLQIYITASDLAICQQLLERQILFWYSEFDEVVVSIESRQGGDKWAQNSSAKASELLALVQSLADQYKKVRYHFIDYSDVRRRLLARSFFGADWIPDQDARGGPFYSYFDAIEETRGRFVLHLDAGVILGGTPRAWVSNAIELLNSKPSYFVVKPLSGLPSMRSHLNQNYLMRQGRYRFVFTTMTGRVFLIDKNKLRHFNIPLEKSSSTLINIKWKFKNNFIPAYRSVELLISTMMQKNGLFRIDYWGESEKEGCFTLYPTKKSKALMKLLPGILSTIDRQDTSESHIDTYELSSESVDFAPHANGSAASLAECSSSLEIGLPFHDQQLISPL